MTLLSLLLASMSLALFLLPSRTLNAAVSARRSAARMRSSSPSISTSTAESATASSVTVSSTPYFVYDALTVVWSLSERG